MMKGSKKGSKKDCSKPAMAGKALNKGRKTK